MYNMKPCSVEVEELEDTMKPKKRNRAADLLFAEEMGKEHLIYGETRVGIDEKLRGKHVGILFSMPDSARDYYRILLQVYNEIRTNYGDVFELVYVPKIDVGYDEYRKLNLSFLAVPFDDLEWRKRLCDMYFRWLDHVGVRDHLLVFDPKGRRLKENVFDVCTDIFEGLTLVYGSAFYPFTAEREMQLIEEGTAALESKSLQILLGGEFVISNDGHTQVPISQLHDKVVGLYFYHDSASLSFQKLLLHIYRQLKDGGHNFEVIFVNVSHCGGYTNKESFLRNLKKMPWLALPFNDERVWRLYSMLTPGEDNDNLTIIGPSHNPFVETRGFPIIEEYGIEAYPFSQDAAVNVLAKRLTTNLKIADFFEGLGIEHLLCKNQKGRTTIRVSSFHKDNQGKGVLLYIARLSNLQQDYGEPPHESETSRLLNMYHKSDESFKVVFLCLDEDSASFDRHFDTMPPSWLAIPFEEADKYSYHKGILCAAPHLIAFDGSTGCLLKIGALEAFGADGAGAFPFITDEDFFKFLGDFLPLRDRYPPPGY